MMTNSVRSFFICALLLFPTLAVAQQTRKPTLPESIARHIKEVSQPAPPLWAYRSNGPRRFQIVVAPTQWFRTPDPTNPLDLFRRDKYHVTQFNIYISWYALSRM
jgi:hypothetical protein